ncbi:MAG: hypothetical protein ACNA8W_18925 [Bradymonadaceae bacterium]
MSADHLKQTQLLETLIKNELIKAAVIVDNKGRTKGRRGKARCLRLGEDEEQTQITSSTIKNAPRESIYIAGAGKEDYLLVIFDEQVSFDSLKAHVDEAIVGSGFTS